MDEKQEALQRLLQEKYQSEEFRRLLSERLLFPANHALGHLPGKSQQLLDRLKGEVEQRLRDALYGIWLTDELQDAYERLVREAVELILKERRLKQSGRWETVPVTDQAADLDLAFKEDNQLERLYKQLKDAERRLQHSRKRSAQRRWALERTRLLDAIERLQRKT